MLILLYRGISPISHLIRLRARWTMWLPESCDRSHAAIVPSDTYHDYADLGDMAGYLRVCSMYEAWHRAVNGERGGVCHRKGISEAHTPGTYVDVYAVDEAFVDVVSVRRFLDLQVGKPYDMRGVMGFVSRRDAAQRDTRWFCSELVAEACLVGGLELLSRIQSHRIHPGMLALSPHLTYLGTAVTNDRYPVFLPSSVAAKRASKIACSASQSPTAPRHAFSATPMNADHCRPIADQPTSTLAATAPAAPRNPPGDPQ